MPLEGPFYIIFLHPRWRMVSAPAKDQESSLGHPDLWEETVVHMLAEHYGTGDPVQVDRLKNACYGFPRGRVCKTGDGYTVWHGRNWGKGVNIRQVKRCILHDFQLAEVIGLRWAFDEHYRTLKADRLVLKRLGMQPVRGKGYK